jgi:hypothetical protein
VCCVGRRRAQRALNDGGNLIVIDRAWPAGPHLIQQAFDAILQEPPPPLAHGVFVNAQFSRNRLTGQAIATSQDDPAAFGH